MKVLLDVNVVLDVLLQRQQWLADAQAVWDAAAGGRLECCLCNRLRIVIDLCRPHSVPIRHACLDVHLGHTSRRPGDR